MSAIPGRFLLRPLTSSDAFAVRVTDGHCTGERIGLSEMCRLRVEDVDSKRMVLRVADGKTEQRYVRLPLTCGPRAAVRPAGLRLATKLISRRIGSLASTPAPLL